jgi:hypothetical protein
MCNFYLFFPPYGMAHAINIFIIFQYTIFSPQFYHYTILNLRSTTEQMPALVFFKRTCFCDLCQLGFNWKTLTSCENFTKQKKLSKLFCNNLKCKLLEIVKVMYAANVLCTICIDKLCMYGYFFGMNWGQFRWRTGETLWKYSNWYFAFGLDQRPVFNLTPRGEVGPQGWTLFPRSEVIP